MRRTLATACALSVGIFVAAAFGRIGGPEEAVAQSTTCSTVGAGLYCGHVCWVMSPYSGCTWVPTYQVVLRPGGSGPEPE